MAFQSELIYIERVSCPFPALQGMEGWFSGTTAPSLKTDGEKKHTSTKGNFNQPPDH